MTSWEVNVPGIEMLATSCVLAVAVILTQFMILGEHSASSYQVRSSIGAWRARPRSLAPGHSA